jgi:hypothetical protein
MASSLRVNAIVPASGTNVAIGTAGGTITYAASVSGVSTFSSGVVIGTGASIASPATNILTISTNNTERIRVGAAGSIGIGTDNPTKFIDITGVHSGINTTGRFVMSPHAAGWDTGVTSGNIHHHYIDNFRLYSGQIGSGTERFKVDSAGRVTMPYQPHAEGGITGLTNSSPSSSTIITFNRVDINVGNHYDTTNYRFNCPVNGNYLVHAHAQANGQTATTANTVNFNIRKNAASVSGVYESRYYGGTAPGYVKLEITDVVYANAGDYLDIYAIISNTSLALEYSAADIRWRFSYTLLG